MNLEATEGVTLDLFAVVLALAVGAARIFGVLSVSPMFTRLGMSGLLRGGVALALSLPLAPLIGAQLASHAPRSVLTLMLLFGKEFLIGLVMGVVFGIPFWAVEIAGELIDQQRQSEAALAPDPLQQSDTGLTGTLLVLSAVTVFFAGGGLHLLFDVLQASYQIWPALDATPHATPAAAFELLSLFDAVLRSGLVLAAPLVAAMLVTEISLALVSRFAPNLNVYDLALSSKSLVYAAGMPIYAGLLIGYFRGSMVPSAELEALLQKLAF